MREGIVVFRDSDVGAFSNPQRVVTRVGKFTKEVAHLCGRLEVVLVAVELESIGVRHQRTGLHAQQSVLHVGVITVHVVNVVRREQRCVKALGNLNQEGVGADLIGNTVILQLDKEVVSTENILQSGRH